MAPLLACSKISLIQSGVVWPPTAGGVVAPNGGGGRRCFFLRLAPLPPGPEGESTPPLPAPLLPAAAPAPLLLLLLLGEEVAKAPWMLPLENGEDTGVLTVLSCWRTLNGGVEGTFT